MKKGEKITLFTTTDVDKETGLILAVYFRVRTGEAAETREFAGGSAFADYDSKGRLLGVEILAPCEVTVLDKISKEEPKPVKTFLRGSMPVQMLASC